MIHETQAKEVKLHKYGKAMEMKVIRIPTTPPAIMVEPIDMANNITPAGIHKTTNKKPS